MTDKHSLIPEIQIVIEHEQPKQSSDSYWAAVSKFYGKVFDGMEYTAYIASGHEPYVVMVAMSAFVKRHKIFFGALGCVGLVKFLLFSWAWMR